ncbi:hypothetical protein AVEN_68121-1, partial [Araneus ventricosus]
VLCLVLEPSSRSKRVIMTLGTETCWWCYVYCWNHRPHTYRECDYAQPWSKSLRNDMAEKHEKEYECYGFYPFAALSTNMIQKLVGQYVL